MKIRQAQIGKVFTAGVLISLLFSFALILFFEAYTLFSVYTDCRLPLPENFGNFDSVRALLAQDKQREEFSFAVVGDTRGRGTFEKITEKLKEEPLSFMVLLGDCARNGTLGYHRYLRAEWAEEMKMPFPVFYIVGNHDVDEAEFSVSQFEKVYGPTNFSFEYQGCLFIGLRILNYPYSTTESAAFLESLLSTRRRDYKKVFVFMHIPPPVSSDFSAREFENSEQFVELFNKYQVNYVFAGDYHGYRRVNLKNTTYLVTGGGGGHLEKQKFGRFHHALVIKVTPDSVSELILQVERQEDFEDTIEMYALAEFYPWLRTNWAVVIALNIIIILSFLAAIIGVKKTA